MQSRPLAQRLGRSIPVGIHPISCMVRNSYCSRERVDDGVADFVNQA
jgi:hypothetical protein